MAYKYLAFNIPGRVKVHLEVQLFTLCDSVNYECVIYVANRTEPVH